MRLVKNQDKWNIVSMNETDLKQVMAAIGFFNNSHANVGKGYMSVTVTCQKQNEVISDPEYLDVLRHNKILNTPKSVQ